MTLEDAENKLSLPGHKGPHPQEYHEEVYRRLLNATDGLSGESYVTVLRQTLNELATEIAIPGSRLNRLITQ